MNQEPTKRRSRSEVLTNVKAALFMIANALIVHEALAAGGAVKGLQPLTGIDKKDPYGWLMKQWSKILATDYGPIFEPALKLLRAMPSHPQLTSILLDAAAVARGAVSTMAVFKQDLAGRLYHTLLLKDIAKSLATYYTSIPAAALLARLAFNTVDPIKWDETDSVKKLCVADFACGSGTLLSAAYTEMVDRYIVSQDHPNLRELHKILLEDVLWGFDVLEYAVHLASTTLVLRDPRVSVTHTNTFVLPLGVINNIAFLGSLDLRVKDDRINFPIRWSLDEIPIKMPEEATVKGKDQKGFNMLRPDIVIMNPPFARTGNIGKSILFGYMPEAEREEVLDEVRRLGESIYKELGLSGGFGRAGEAAYFLLKSFTAVKDRGVLAFVLPRVFLSGSDWSPIREVLVKRGWTAYVMVSDDPKYHWAWSENTDLSEILLVYKKCCRDSKTVVTFVRKRPESALEAKILADRIMNTAQKLPIESVGYSSTAIIRGEGEGSALAYVYAVSEDALKDVASANLNLALGFHTAELSSRAYTLYKQHELLGVKLPLKPLPEYLLERRTELDKCFKKSKDGKRGKRHRGFEDYVGYDVAQVRRKCLNKGNIPIRALMEINMDSFSSIEIDPQFLEQTRVPLECFCRAGRLHIPGVARFRLTTLGVMAAYTGEPTISQVTWTVPIVLEEAKIQALWLNTTPGLLHILSLRQDSAGGFVQVKKETLHDLLFLGVKKLTNEQKASLLDLVDKVRKVKMDRLAHQLEEAAKKQGVRYEIDRAFLEIFGLDIEKDDIAWSKMKEIYEELADETLLRPPQQADEQTPSRAEATTR
jgi:hypothetical protein